jgi:hypothetical protein
MSKVFLPTLVLHVVVAVLGVGSVVSVPIFARTAQRTPYGAPVVLSWLSSLLRYSTISLVVMLVTGILLDLPVHGAFRHFWWFRGSALLLFATGALHGLGRRTVRWGLTNEANRDAALRRVERIGYAMCAIVLAITILMVVKPF